MPHPLEHADNWRTPATVTSVPGCARSIRAGSENVPYST